MTNKNSGTSRRRVLQALVASGALAGITSTASADEIGIGGGSMSDELSHLKVNVYDGPESEIPEPGVDGRYFHVKSGGSLWNAGDLLEDTGSSWEKVDLGVGSVSAGEIAIGDRHTTVPASGDCPDIEQAINQYSDDEWSKVSLVPGARYDVLDPLFTEAGVLIDSEKTILDLNGATIYLPDGTTETDRGKQIIHVGDTSRGASQETIDDVIITGPGTIDGNWQNQGNISGTWDGHNVQLNGLRNKLINVNSINSTGDGVETISRQTDANGDPTTQQITINNNTFIDSYEQAIHLHGSKDVVADGNMCVGEQTGGLVHLNSEHAPVDNAIFSNNIFRDSVVDQRAVIHLDVRDSSQSGESIYFIDNIVKDCPNNTAIRTHGGRMSDVVIRGNEIKNNQKGISMVGADRTWVEDNNIEGHDEMGIDVLATIDTSYLYIRGNTIYNNNRGDTNSEAINFRFDGSTHDNIFVERNDLVSDSAPLHQYAVFFNEATAGTYEDIFVRDNYIEGVNIANHIDGVDVALTVDNVGNDDSRSSLPPVTAVEGLKYLDDGTNRSDTSYGYREYIGGAWRDL